MIDLYTKPNCTFCTQAKQLLDLYQKPYREIPIGESIMVEELKERFPLARTAPVVIVDGIFVGGFTELKSLFESSPQLLTE
jgi:glutaredoxin